MLHAQRNYFLQALNELVNLRRQRHRGVGRGEFAVPAIVGQANLVLLAHGQDILHILARGGKRDAFHERDVILRVVGVDPFERVAASGIILGERKGNRVVGLGPAFDRVAEIPRAGADIGDGIVEIIILKSGDLVGLGPHPPHFGSHLHETLLIRRAMRVGLEFAFPPDERANEKRIDPAAAGDAGNDRVVRVFLGLVLAPIKVGALARQDGKQEKEKQDGKRARAHELSSNLAGESARLLAE